MLGRFKSRYSPSPDLLDVEWRRQRANARAGRLLTGDLPSTAEAAKKAAIECAGQAHEHLKLEAEICHLNLNTSEGKLRAAAEQALHEANLGIRRAQLCLLYTVFASTEHLESEPIFLPGMDAHKLAREGVVHARECLARVYKYVAKIESLRFAKIHRILRLIRSGFKKQGWGRYDLEKAGDVASQVLRGLESLVREDNALICEKALATLSAMDMDELALIKSLSDIVDDVVASNDAPADYNYPILILRLLGVRALFADLPASPWVFEWTSDLLLLEAWLYFFAAQAADRESDETSRQRFVDLSRDAMTAARVDASEAKYLRMQIMRGIGQVRMQRRLVGWPSSPDRRRHKRWYLCLCSKLY